MTLLLDGERIECANGFVQRVVSEIYSSDNFGCHADAKRVAEILNAHFKSDYTRAGNLSPDYLLAQDRARRESETPSHSVTSAERGA